MNKADQHYQAVVDELAASLLGRQPVELAEYPDYGSLRPQAGNELVEVGFWHHAFSDDRHDIVFKAERRVFLFLYRSYIAGVVFGRELPPRLMTPEEAGEYD